MTIGGNPFSGFSHQNAQRDAEMLDYYSVARVKQTLADCEAAGINTCCLRTDAHIWRMLREYRNDGGRIQWIAQMGVGADEYKANVNQAVANGAIAYYIHGGVTGDISCSGTYGYVFLFLSALPEVRPWTGRSGSQRR
jgi:hypothetical protein